jgi:inhibitor of KinA sporulation pathway (predicted exonuclease)
VDNGVILEKSLDMVHKFLEDNGLFKSEFVFLSCGDFDGHHLRKEALFKKIDIPNYLKRWINIKRVFPIHLFEDCKQQEFNWPTDLAGKPPVGGMPHMLNLCKLELEGKHHSGIDDAKNIARVAINLMEKGFEFK